MEPVAIRLKKKYCIGFSSSQKSGGGNSGTNKHKGIDAKAKKLLKPWPEMAMYCDAGTGRCRMRKTGRIMCHSGTQVIEYKNVTT